MGNEHERMKVAIKDARKAFNPAAVEDYRKTSHKLARVQTNEQVRERYSRFLQILEENLITNKLSYKTQQVLNFFILQGRINTRLVSMLIFRTTNNAKI